jgi:hypothetical protein
MHTLILTPDQKKPDEFILEILKEKKFSFVWVNHLDTTRMYPCEAEVLRTKRQPFLLMNATTLLRYFHEIANTEREVYVFVAREINLTHIELEVVPIDPDVFDLPFAPAT